MTSSRLGKPISARVLLSGLILLALCAYSAAFRPREVKTIGEIFRGREQFAGLEVRVSSARVVEVGPAEARLEQRGWRMPLRVAGGPLPGNPQLAVGDYVSVRAIVHSAGYLLPIEVHVQRGRQLKVWVSILGLVVLATALLEERSFA